MCACELFARHCFKVNIPKCKCEILGDDMRLMIIALALAILAGCSTIGPNDPQAFSQAVNSSIPDKEGKVAFTGNGLFFPNAKGYEGVSTAVANGVYYVRTITITNRGIFIQQWESDAERFSIIKKIPMEAITDVYLENKYAMKTITVRSGEYQYDAFKYFDGDKTDSAATYLRTLVQK